MPVVCKPVARCSLYAARSLKCPTNVPCCPKNSMARCDAEFVVIPISALVARSYKKMTEFPSRRCPGAFDGHRCPIPWALMVAFVRSC